MSTLISSAGFLMMACGLAGLFATGSFFSRNPVATIVQCAAFALILWARHTFGVRSLHFTAGATTGGLVTSGPYRFVRHPIYAGAIVLGWAGILAHWSLRSALLGVLLVAGALLRILLEERSLRSRYPEYVEFARTTKRIIPGIF